MRRIALFALATAFFALPAQALASHAWGSYHWARTANPFTLKLGDNVSSSWDSYLGVASSDWSTSTVLDTTIVGGLGGRNCKAQTGRVEVCAGRYGWNGWLGIAQIWVSEFHITKGVVKLNETYFGLSTYNKPAWKQHVMCQEIGHTFGLDHQDESGASLGTCMDYSNDPTASQHPNAHDYDQLRAIYQHLDSTTTALADADGGPGKGKPEKVRDDLWVEEFGNGVRRFTFVYWVSPGVPHDAPVVE
jgi:hypothetical protein